MGRNLSKLSDSPGGARTNGKPKRKVSAETRRRVKAFIEQDYIKSFCTSAPELTNLLSLIPMDEDILQVYYENGFNLLQKCVAENNVEAVQLILSRDPDLNSGPCSLPLHIACLKGYSDCVEDLIEHGARLDVEARMCWPGPHSADCPGLRDESKLFRREIDLSGRPLVTADGRDKCQNAMFYAIDGGQSNVLDYLLGIHKREPQGTCELRPLLEAASKNRAWCCCYLLLESKADEIDSNTFRDFVDPIPGEAVEMTLYHVLFFMVNKPADFTLRVCRAFVSGGLESQISTVDLLGNTPLHSLIVRYAFEESRRLWLRDYEPWGPAETKEMIKLLLDNGAVETLNQPGNSILSFIIHHIKDWRFIYDLLSTVLDVGASPAVKDRNGHCPLMACIVKLISDDLFETFDAESKLFFMHCLRLLCTAGANPNSVTESSLTPLHILVFTVSENFLSPTDKEMIENFDFLRDILVLLFQFGLDANVTTTNGAPSVLHGILKLVKKSRYAIDLDKVYELVLTLIQYGANPNLQVQFPDTDASVYGEGNPFPVADYHHLLGYMFVALAEKEDILNECQDSFTRILYLLYFSMDHDELYKCLNFLYIQFPAILPDRPCQILSDTVTDMLSEPRTLKQMARTVINRSLGRKPGIYADQLPLAKRLRNYLINYDP